MRNGCGVNRARRSGQLLGRDGGRSTVVIRRRLVGGVVGSGVRTDLLHDSDQDQDGGLIREEEINGSDLINGNQGEGKTER